MNTINLNYLSVTSGDFFVGTKEEKESEEILDGMLKKINNPLNNQKRTY